MTNDKLICPPETPIEKCTPLPCGAAAWEGVWGGPSAKNWLQEALRQAKNALKTIWKLICSPFWPAREPMGHQKGAPETTLVHI